MAHELDYNVATGRKSVFSVKKTMWHHEGFVVDAPPTLVEARKLAGTDYLVGLKPLYLEGATEPVPGAKAVVRDDRGTVLGVVGNRYNVIQNEQAFSVLEPLVDSGIATIETGGTIREGRKAWMLVQFKVDDPVVREVFADEVVPFGLVTTDHTGSAPVTLKNTPVRVVCANTLRSSLAGRGDAQTVRHFRDGNTRVVEAAEALYGGLVERYRGIAEQYASLKAKYLTVDQFLASVADTLAPLPVATADADAEEFQLELDAAAEKRERLFQLWMSGDGHKGDGSAWEAYNGAVQSLDHDKDLWKTRGSRIASAVDGKLAQLHGQVLEAVLAVK